MKIDHEKTNAGQERKGHRIQLNVRKRRKVKDQSDTDFEEEQIISSGFRILVQENLTRRNKVQDEVIDFPIESKKPPREVAGRKTAEGRQEETIKKAISGHKKAATEYKERDTAEIYNQSKKKGKGNQDKKR